jgi:ABC-type multidrug transport system fused ATPase/permease subunit
MQMKGYAKSVYDTLLQAYRPFIVRIGILLFLGFIGRYILLSNAQLIGEFLDRHESVTREDLKSLFFKLSGILAVSFTLTVLFRTWFSSLSALAVSRIYDETTFRVSRFPISFFENQPVGKITTRFSSDYGNVFRLFGGPLAEFLSILFDLTSIVILMLIIHPIFLITITFSALIYSILLKKNQAALRKTRRELSSHRAPSISHFSETVQGSGVIRQNKKENIFIEKFNEYDTKYLATKWNVFWHVTKFSFELNLLSTVLFAVNGIICIILFQNKVIGAGMTAVVLSFTLLATHTLQMFFEWFSQFEEAFTGLEKMDEYLRLPIEPGSLLPLNSDFSTSHAKRQKVSLDSHAAQTSIEFAKNHLQVEAVYFSYPESTQNILKDIHFSLKKGEKLGIIGRTGSGKSTLIAILLRLYPVQKGAVLVNGVAEPDVEKYRAQFSVISQDQLFLAGTIRDNLDLFRKNSNEELDSILKKVGLKYQLSDRVTERGQNLSYGEKQLLSLARGLLQKAEIFIFDEATSNVDPQSEALMNRALKDLLIDKTQIRIAHRLQTVQDCDRILWLDDGRIKMLGNTQEVLETFKNSR